MKDFLSQLIVKNKSNGRCLPFATTDKVAKVLGLHRSASYHTIRSTSSIGEEAKPYGFLDDQQLSTSNITGSSELHNLIGNNASTSTIATSSFPATNSTPINAVYSTPAKLPGPPSNVTPAKAAKVLGLAEVTPSRVSVVESSNSSWNSSPADLAEDASTSVNDTSDSSRHCQVPGNKAPTVDDPFPAILYYRTANARWYHREELQEREDIHDEVQEILMTRYSARKKGEKAMDVARQLLYELNDAVMHEVDMTPYYTDPMKWFPEGFMVAVAMAFLERVEKLDI